MNIEHMQAEADAAHYLAQGNKATDDAIESYYRDDPAAHYSLNEFIEAVYSLAEAEDK